MGTTSSSSAAKAVSRSVFMIVGSVAAASSTLVIHLYSASSPGIGGTCFMTMGSCSKKTAGSTHGGCLVEYLGRVFSWGTGNVGSLVQSLVFILPSNWLS